MAVGLTLMCAVLLQGCGDPLVDPTSAPSASEGSFPADTFQLAAQSDDHPNKQPATSTPPSASASSAARPPAASSGSGSGSGSAPSATPAASAPSSPASSTVVPDPTTIPAGARVLHVAPDGDDSRNGCCLKAGAAGGPLRTIQRAQEIIRAARAQNAWPAGGFVVMLAPGRFELGGTLQLDGRDSGNANAPVIYRGSTAGGLRTTRVVGSVRLQGARRANHEARADLVRVTAGRALGKDSQVVAGNRLLSEARWPNEGYTTISQVSGSAVALAGQVPALPPGAAVSIAGFVQHEWLYESIAGTAGAGGAINAASGTLRTGARAFLVGSSALLDTADEYLVEPATNTVVVSRTIVDDPTLEVSVLPTLVSANGAKHVRFEQLSFCNTTANGLDLLNVENVTVAFSEVCNTAGQGVRLSGTASGVVNSHVHSTGGTGVYLYGGNRQDLTAGRNFVESSYIEDVGRRVKSYSPAVATEGVGSIVRGNVVRNLPHVGIIFTGNNHTIAFNDITDVVKEAGDMGAIYSGRDWTARGNLIRGNLIYDIPAPATNDPRGIYLDDQFSSATIESNIFSNVKYGVFIGGGRDNVVRRNVFFSSGPSIFFDARGLDNPTLIAGNKPTLEAKLAAVPVDSPAWLTQFPAVARLRSDNPMAPIGNRIYENVFVDGQPIHLQGPSPASYLTDVVGPRIDVRSTTGARWTGMPGPDWFKSIASKAPQAASLFPWDEFQKRREQALRARQ